MRSFDLCMLKRINILLIICLLDFFLIPTQSCTCKFHSKEIVTSESLCCSVNKQHDSEDEREKDCCKSNDRTSNECSGKCGSASCHSSLNSFSATLPVSKYVQNNLIFESKKSYSLYQQHAYTSQGSSIWQPPKIG